MKLSKCCKAQVELMPSNDADREDVAVCQNCNHVCKLIETKKADLEYLIRTIGREVEDWANEDSRFHIDNTVSFKKQYILEIILKEKQRLVEELKEEIKKMVIVDSYDYLTSSQVVAINNCIEQILFILDNKLKK
jgi:hypothetical protein